MFTVKCNRHKHSSRLLLSHPNCVTKVDTHTLHSALCYKMVAFIEDVTTRGYRPHQVGVTMETKSRQRVKEGGEGWGEGEGEVNHQATSIGLGAKWPNQSVGVCDHHQPPSPPPHHHLTLPWQPKGLCVCASVAIEVKGESKTPTITSQ